VSELATPGATTSTPRTRNIELSGLIGLGLVVIVVVVSLVGPMVVERPATDTAAILQGPSRRHLLGTDFSGRDNLALLVRGGAEMLLLATVAGGVTSLIALAVGLTAALAGGAVDRLLTYLTDLWLTIPRFILLLVVASLIRLNSTVSLAVLIAVFGWPYLARQLRVIALSASKRAYVEASRSLQLGFWYVARHCLFPPMAPFLVIATIQAMTQAIYQQVGLSFFGIIPLTDNWGTLFSLAYRQNALYSPAAAPTLLGPVAAIVVLQLGLVLTSRTLEQAFDPRLRTLSGRS
jgi:peptide/nickel transport system permease protein